jgi:hypothetical protein
MIFSLSSLLFSQIYFAVAFRNDEKFLKLSGAAWVFLAIYTALKATN